MNKSLNTLTTILFVFVIACCFQSCVDLEKKSVVKQKCLQYLKNKYNKDFKILAFDQRMSGADWKYHTRLLVSPKDDKSLTFDLPYDTYDRSVIGDYYKSRLWYKQFKDEVEPIVSKTFSALYMEAMFGEKKETYLDCSDMKYYNNYRDLLKDIEEPASHISIYISASEKYKEAQFDCFVELCHYLARQPFVVNKLEIYFCKSEFFKQKPDKYNHLNTYTDSTNCYSELCFKFSKKDSVPNKVILKELVEKTSRYSPLYEKNGLLYNEALNEKDNQKAIAIYRQIIASVSKYRYSPYPVVQSAYAVRSANNAAGLLELEGKPEEAKKLYQFIVDYFEFEKDEGKNNDYCQNARTKPGLEQ